MVAVRGPYPRLHRIVDHFRREAVVFAHHLEGLGFAYLAREFPDLAVAVSELDRVAGLEEIQTLANARQLPDLCQIGCVERHAAKYAVQGVVSADDHFNGRSDIGLLRNGRARLRGGGCCGRGGGRHGRRAGLWIDQGCRCIT